MIRRGEPWERASGGPADAEIAGSDAALAEVVACEPGARVRFTPDATSDLARALGLPIRHPTQHAEFQHDDETTSTEMPVDILRVRLDRVVGANASGRSAATLCAVNMVVSGLPPDRLGVWARRGACRIDLDDTPWWEGAATSVVVANGEYLRGADLVPRGHPGDGRLEVQVYALAPSERRSMRDRLGSGTHLPHPRIQTGQGQRVVLRWASDHRLEVDGVAQPGAHSVEVVLDPAGLVIVR